VSFRVEITRTAAREVSTRFDEMASRTRASAERWRDGLIRAISSLADNPLRCPEAPEAGEYGPGLRELYYGKRRNTYRILFEVRGDVVFVLPVRHGRQDLLGPDELIPPG